MEKNVLLTIEYDGTGFSGWQRQPEARTVQGTVEKTLTDLIGEPVTVDGVSRTDAGVHARDQKAVFRADLRVPVENLARVLNDRLQGRQEARSENDDIRIPDLNLTSDTKWVQDFKGNNLLLFTSDWCVNWALQKNEGLRLREFNRD